MKKIIKIFIGIIILIFILILGMVRNNDKNYNKMIKEIENNTLVKEVEYINKYNNYFIVEDNEYLYLINDKYEIISEIDINLLYKNSKNYDIIYKDERFMYMEDNYKDGKLYYKYYDIYNYSLIDEIMVGG